MVPLRMASQLSSLWKLTVSLAHIQPHTTYSSSWLSLWRSSPISVQLLHPPLQSPGIMRMLDPPASICALCRLRYQCSKLLTYFPSVRVLVSTDLAALLGPVSTPWALSALFVNQQVNANFCLPIPGDNSAVITTFLPPSANTSPQVRPNISITKNHKNCQMTSSVLGKYYLLTFHDYTLMEILDSVPPGFTFGIANIGYVSSVLDSSTSHSASAWLLPTWWSSHSCSAMHVLLWENFHSLV